MKRKRLAVFAAVILTLIIAAACGNSTSTTSSSNSENAGNANNHSVGSTNESESGNAPAVEPLVFKMSHMAGTDHVMYSLTMKPFSEQVEELTEGRVIFEIYPGAAIAAPNEQWDAVVTGIADAAWHVAGYTPGVFPLHSIINLPFLTKGTSEQIAEVVYRLYEQFPEIQAEYKDVKPLWMFGTDEYAIITANKQIKTFEDVKGLKLRAPNPEGALAIESWGATPVSMPANDLYDALQKGVVDGSVSTASQIADFNLYDVVKYYTHGHFVSSLNFEPMNLDSWNKISEEDKKILEEQLIGLPMSKVAGAAFDAAAKTALEKAEETGVIFNHLPEEELKKFEKASRSVTENYIADLEAKGLPAQEVYEAAKKMFAEIANQ